MTPLPRMPRLEVLFTPADFRELAHRDLSGSTCVVFDVLRATSTMLRALSEGAAGIRPASTIEEALALRRLHPAALLAGERDGYRIRAEQTGGTDFDLGNSPREFTAERVAGREIVMTTTNGTRALRAAASARTVWIGSMTNLSAMAGRLLAETPEDLLLVCSGTHENASFEDTFAAGALVDRLWSRYGVGNGGQPDDSAQMARDVHLRHASEGLEVARHARNGRRISDDPQLSGDLPWCLVADRCPILGRLDPDGVIRRASAS